MTKARTKRAHADTDEVDVTPRLSPLPSTSPEVLRELAAVIEKRDPARRARRSLDADSLEELADMLLSGKRPTVGWWCRHLPKDRES
jgi:hypothetical protein